ncbi:hypothetical protein C7H19_18125 [Aphanothece hegewaldii CCALA 016]|uniref:GUN4-like domain-containing protein n=1 Tax=Aphanothece hegewaldii CCALA 016 TaxID=2107694 RepID=A0A2T1LU01_9CHRO|nr:tetratricopeptide repeat protein [Aphanothece hegewaldii]PSF34925.1 hypothetical protein C7H19_18125 [Aphanothece hegewaldii CCALA 016]
MYFQITPPSISRIRAKFIIEKLSNSPQNSSLINIFATGRTHSGKTTLGNRLLGVDYFLSTGRQDCTKEINLIEFPNGLKYFDLPGVCSDDRLENYNRVALNMSQFEEFPFVDELTLARYKENQSPSEQNLSISHYEKLNFKPDLIYYLIAPDKQFARGDRKYLTDLLKRHQNIIYVFNMFVNKQTGICYAATEANIQDVATQILKIHRNILGENSQPKIVGVNCWTGEGIAELLHQSEQILLGEKGKVFQELIEYQQQKTPDEYVNQVKQELIRLYAHAACEKATGSDSCDQPLHRICHTLFDFLANLPIQSKQSDNLITQRVNTIVNQIISKQIEITEIESSEDKLIHVLRSSDYILNQSIYYFDELIEHYIRDVQRQVDEIRDQELDDWKKQNKFYHKQLNQKEEILISEEAEINSLIQSLQSKEENLRDWIDQYNSSLEEYNEQYEDYMYQYQKFNSRLERWKQRVDRYNANIDKIQRSSARLTYEAQQSIEQESDYLDEERTAIESESGYIDSMSKDLEEEKEYIDKESEAIDLRIPEIEREKKNLNQKIESFNRKHQKYYIFKKNYDDEFKMFYHSITVFDEELSSLNEKINARINEINIYLQEIASRHFSENYFNEFSSLEDGINELQKFVNCCSDELAIFENQIFTFHQELKKSIFRLSFNKVATQVLQKTTEHYFDEAGEFEYRGSQYHYFCQHGITLCLAITMRTLVGTKKGYKELYDDLFSKVTRLGIFPDNPEESKILDLLISKVDLLFDNEFDINSLLLDLPFLKRWDDLSNLPQVEKEDSNSILILFNQALQLSNSGKNEEAIACYDKLLQIEPNNGGAWFNRAGDLSSLNKYKDAIYSYTKVLECKEFESGFYDAYMNRGNLLKLLERYGEALFSFNKALQINPNDALAWSWRGYALYFLDRYEEALDSFNKSLQYEPIWTIDDPNWKVIIWWHRAFTLKRLCNYEEAIISFNKVLEFNPNHDGALLQRGEILYKVFDQNEEALACFNKALQLNSNNADAWCNRALILSSLNRYEEALASFDKCLQIQPDDADTWLKRAYLSITLLNKPEEGLASFDKIIELKSDKSYGYYNKGSLLKSLGRYEEALTYFDKAIEIKPDDANAWNDRGFVLEQLAKHEEAGISYSRAEYWSQRKESYSQIELITVNANYEQLDQFLLQKKWKEADQETSKLMLRLCRRDGELSLTEDDCRKFPYEELKIIDDLWVKYSNGRFGFSVQKRIWIDCGGVPGEVDQDIFFQSWSERIGWKSPGESGFKSYSELISNVTNASLGQFPIGGCFKVGYFCFCEDKDSTDGSLSGYSICGILFGHVANL